jgi:hypothetical protein
VSKAEFLDMGLGGVQAGYNYYTAIYNTPGGELYDLKQAYQGAGVFNFKKLAELRPAALEALIDLLAKFEFPEFTEEFLAGMKAELPEVIRHAQQPFDFSKVDGAEAYDAALARRLLKKAYQAAAASSSSSSSSSSRPAADDEDDPVSARETQFDKWEDDPMEMSRRIWEWWRARLCGVSVFKYWSLAVRLVVLVQTSSARMERIFSQLKLILETIGYSALEKTVEGRLLVRVNKGQYGE